MSTRLLVLIFLIQQIDLSVNDTKGKEECAATQLHSMFYYSGNFYVITDRAIYRYEKIETKKRSDAHSARLVDQVEIVFPHNESDQNTLNFLHEEKKFSNHSGILVYTNRLEAYLIYLFKAGHKELLDFGQSIDAGEISQLNEKKYENSSWGFRSEDTYIYLIFNKSSDTLTIDHRFIKENGSEAKNLIYTVPNFKVFYIGLIPFIKNGSIQSAYSLIVDQDYLVHINPIERDTKSEEISLFDLILCKRRLCDRDFKLKGFTYFYKQQTYAYFVDNTFILSPKGLVDLYQENGENASVLDTPKPFFRYSRISRQPNYFGSFVYKGNRFVPSVFYHENVIYKMSLKDEEIRLDSIFEFADSGTEKACSSNCFENVTGLIGFDKGIIVFLSEHYIIYKNETHFRKKFFEKTEHDNQIPISSLINDKLQNHPPISLASVNLMNASELIFRYINLNSNQTEIILVVQKFSYDAQLEKLIPGLDFKYKINQENCGAISSLSSGLIRKFDFKLKNLMLVLTFFMLSMFIIFTMFVTFVRPKIGKVIFENHQSDKVKTKRKKHRKHKKKTKNSDQQVVWKTASKPSNKIFEEKSYAEKIVIKDSENKLSSDKPTTSFEFFSPAHALKFNEFPKSNDLDFSSGNQQNNAPKLIFKNEIKSDQDRKAVSSKLLSMMTELKSRRSENIDINESADSREFSGPMSSFEHERNGFDIKETKLNNDKSSKSFKLKVIKADSKFETIRVETVKNVGSLIISIDTLSSNDDKLGTKIELKDLKVAVETENKFENKFGQIGNQKAEPLMVQPNNIVKDQGEPTSLEEKVEDDLSEAKTAIQPDETVCKEIKSIVEKAAINGRATTEPQEIKQIPEIKAPNVKMAEKAETLKGLTNKSATKRLTTKSSVAKLDETRSVPEHKTDGFASEIGDFDYREGKIREILRYNLDNNTQFKNHSKETTSPNDLNVPVFPKTLFRKHYLNEYWKNSHKHTAKKHSSKTPNPRSPSARKKKKQHTPRQYQVNLRYDEEKRKSWKINKLKEDDS